MEKVFKDGAITIEKSGGLIVAKFLLQVAEFLERGLRLIANVADVHLSAHAALNHLVKHLGCFWGYQSRNLPLALAANELAIAAKPSSLDARYNFALTLRDANYPADAAHELSTILKSNPEEIRAHFALANIYAQQLDQPLLARKHYLAVLELNPSHSEAPLVRQWLASNH